MKQSITKEQWNEMSSEDRLKFLGRTKERDDLIKTATAGTIYSGDSLPTIGQLIEFLGVEEFSYIDDTIEKGCIEIKKDWSKGVLLGWWGEEELIDVLWELVKEKLKKE